MFETYPNCTKCKTYTSAKKIFKYLACLEKLLEIKRQILNNPDAFICLYNVELADLYINICIKNIENEIVLLKSARQS